VNKAGVGISIAQDNLISHLFCNLGIIKIHQNSLKRNGVAKPLVTLLVSLLRLDAPYG
jgi:hypothetical protein